MCTGFYLKYHGIYEKCLGFDGKVGLIGIVQCANLWHNLKKISVVPQMILVNIEQF